MKRFLLMAVMVFMTVAANAQFYVGGSATLQAVHYDDDTTLAFGIAPELGYNIDDMWSVGASIGFNSVKPDGGDSVNTFSVLPYVRGKFLRAGDFTFFGDLYGGYESMSWGGHNENGWTVGLRPGVAFNLADNWSLTATTSLLSYDKWGKKGTTTIGVDMSDVTVGIYYNF